MCSVETSEVNDNEAEDTSPLMEESPTNVKDLHPAQPQYRSESINIKNFNYDVIVHFVSQGKRTCRIVVIDGLEIFPIRDLNTLQIFLSATQFIFIQSAFLRININFCFQLGSW